MKSSKLKATLAAVSAIAVMASASTSFAAVNTIATYNTTTNKVDVVATVSGLEANKEVTYLVKNGETIVYIDQATLSTTGEATFSYKIAKDKITNLQTAVTYGTDGSVAAPAADSLGFDKVRADATNATIEYYTDEACTADKKIADETVVAGKGETIYAKITPDTGYEIKTVTIGETPQTQIKTVYSLIAGQTITVTAEKTSTAPVVITADPAEDNVTGMTAKVDGVDVDVKKSVTTVLKVANADEVTEYGVIFDGVAYPAINTGNNANVAVRILTTDDTEISKDAVSPYYKKSGVYYYAVDNTEIK